jgi:hypothetical protein
MGVFERTCELRLVLNTLLRIVSGIYFVLTSIYCLLAFLPYTFFFLIKAPPYSWMPWFAPSGNPVLCSGKCSGGSKLAAARGLGETRAQISYRRGTAACRRRLPGASIHFCESSKTIERPIAGAWRTCFP